MKKLKIATLFIIMALVISSLGTAALSAISFDRSVSAGQVLLDTDPNVAVQIINTSDYDGLVKTQADGKVSLDLNQAINSSLSNGFNTDATFSIGTASSGVIKIRNNSDIPVTVTLTNDTNNAGALVLSPTSVSSSTIAVGTASDFYFTIDTNGQDAVKTLSATLHISGN